MENQEKSSSILLSIFKRKGGEGFQTKIISDENKIMYHDQLILLDKNESPLICYKQDDLNWLLLTDKRIFGERKGSKWSILFSELASVDFALQEEFRNGVSSKTDFTHLILTDKKEKKYSIEIEKGNAFQGIYQVLHYIAG